MLADTDVINSNVPWSARMNGNLDRFFCCDRTSIASPKILLALPHSDKVRNGTELRDMHP